jgi:hypothetical protein
LPERVHIAYCASDPLIRKSFKGRMHDDVHAARKPQEHEKMALIRRLRSVRFDQTRK